MVESLKSDKWAETRLSSHYQLPGRRFGSHYCSNLITPVFGLCIITELFGELLQLQHVSELLLVFLRSDHIFPKGCQTLHDDL